MTATTQARPKLWPLVVAIAACVFIALMFLAGGKTAANSATPRANAPFALADDTVTVTEPAPPPVTVVSTKNIYLPPSETYFTTVVVNSLHVVNTQVVHNRTNVVHQTQINHVNSTAVFNVSQTNQVNATVLATRQIVKPVNVTNSVIVTNTAQETNTATATATVEIQSAAKTKPLADRARLAIGAGGVAVTSAAGFGFLMLRRRGRYTS